MDSLPSVCQFPAEGGESKVYLLPVEEMLFAVVQQPGDNTPYKLIVTFGDPDLGGLLSIWIILKAGKISIIVPYLLMWFSRLYGIVIAVLLLLRTGPSTGQYLAACAHWKNTSADSLCRYAHLARQQAYTAGNEGDRLLADCYCANCLLLQARADSAQQLLDRTFGALQDSSRLPVVYEQLGQIQVTLMMRSDKYKDAIAASLRYLSFAEARQDTLFEIVFRNLIGVSHMKMLQKQDALEWYRKGLATSSNPRFYRQFPIIYGNLGILYATMGKLDSAAFYSSLAIAYERDSLNYSGLTGVLPALGVIYMETNRQKQAAAAFSESLETAQRLNDPYMSIAADVSNATYQGNTGNYQKSIGICLSAIDLILVYRLRSQLPYIYKTLADDYKATGDFKHYSEALEQLAVIKDSAVRKNSAAAIADLQMKYESQKKENTIIKQQIELGRKNSWIYGGFILSAVIILFSFLLFRLNRGRQQIKMELMQKEQRFRAEQEVKDAEEKERLRVAAELHDDLGTRINILSHAASRLMEVSPDIGLQIKETSNDLMQSLRETVWTLKQESILSSDVWVRFKNFVFKLRDAYSVIRFEIREEGGTEKKLPYKEALHLIRILQEAAGNAVKHAGCTELVCEKKMAGDTILFSITDNGKGFLPVDESNLQGNGIFNMRQRAMESDFGFVLASEPGKGCRVEVRV
jgi:signal transduction histidine kinase